MTNNVLDQIVFGHPQDHQHGGHANEPCAEIQVEHYTAKRDKEDGSRRIDLALTLKQDQSRKLLAHLTEHADEAQVTFVVELRPRVIGIMPPDPLGPAALAAYNFASAMNAPPPGGQDADTTPAEYLVIATRLLSQLKAGFSFGPTYVDGTFSIPYIADQPRTNNPSLDDMLGTLIEAVNAVGATMDEQFNPSNNPLQLAALLALHGAVEKAFS